MLANMDWQKFFHYDPKVWTIEKALDNLGKSNKPKWPLNDYEELRVRRRMPPPESYDVKYLTGPTREFSCTFGLEVTAWAMFINAIDQDVTVYSLQEQAHYRLAANALEMLPKIKTAFTLNVRCGSEWIRSSLICFEELLQSKSPNAARTLSLRCNSFVDVVIVRNEEVLRFVLEYRLEADSRRLLKLRSKFVVTNFTDVDLIALPLAMDHKETSTREEVEAFSLAKKPCNIKPTNLSKNWYILLSFICLNKN